MRTRWWGATALVLGATMLMAVVWLAQQQEFSALLKRISEESRTEGADQSRPTIGSLASEDELNFKAAIKLSSQAKINLSDIVEKRNAIQSARTEALSKHVEDTTRYATLKLAQQTLDALWKLDSKKEDFSSEDKSTLEIAIDSQKILVKKLADNSQIGLFGITAIAFVILAGGIAFLALRRRSEKMGKQSKQSRPNEYTPEDINGGGRSLTPSSNAPQEMLKVTRPAVQGFLIEATASAGPRKTVAEYEDTENFAPEFCEDSTGIITFGNAYQLWWLSDGTTPLGYQPAVGDHSGLSTRMLARDIGDCFVHHLDIHASDTATAQAKIFVELRHIWQLRLDGYIAALKASDRLEAFKSGCPQNADGSYVLKWSTTFLGGILIDRDETSDLQIFYAGDSGGLVFFRNGDSIAAEIIEPNSKRVFVQAIIRDETATVRVLVPNNAMQSMTFENIEGFVALSDGAIKADLGKFLVGLKAAAAHRSIEEIRLGLINRNDKSYDDKSMVFGHKIRV